MDPATVLDDKGVNVVGGCVGGSTRVGFGVVACQAIAVTATLELDINAHNMHRTVRVVSGTWLIRKRVSAYLLLAFCLL